MPPKKKIVDDNGDDPDRSLLSVDDYTLPKSMILRLAKGVLPANTQIQKDALTAILKSTTVFVNYLASNADDRAQLANKKTIRPEDVFGALEEVEFGGFTQRVQMELNKYQDIQNNKRNDYRRRVKEDQDPDSLTAGDQAATEQGADSVSFLSQREEKSTTPRVVTLGNGAEDSDPDADNVGDEPPAAKKARTSLAGGSRPNGHGRRSGYSQGNEDDDTISVPEDDEEEEELDYQSAEEDLPDDEVEDDEVQDDDEMGDTLDASDVAGMNPDPDDDDPGGSDEE